MLRDKVKKIIAGILYFSGINFIYNKIYPQRLILIGGHSVIKHGNKTDAIAEIYKDLSIDDKFLEKQINYLLKNGYRFLNFEMINEILNNGKTLPQKSVIVYFDDGFKDNYQNVYPIFKKYNLPFVIFVSTDLIDQKQLSLNVKGKLGELSKTGNKVFLNWEEIRSMLDLAEIGSHGKTHINFIELREKELKEELLYSIKRINDETDKAPIALSYPHGKYEQKTKEIVRGAGFQFAVTTKQGKADINDRFTLKKIVIYPEENMTIFKLKLGIFTELKIY
ncbi:MAG: polysaccharide deacetylase family protein [Nanoarchaeota archaeon]|nr:polysaccharide deacetylase family protein [Nanoarchaeota archaeon]